MKNGKWPSVQLGEHVDLLCGFAFKSKDFTDDANDIPLVKGANVHQGYIDWSDSKYWRRSNASEYSRYFLESDDVVLAMDRPWIEAGLKFSWIRKHHPKSLLVQRVARMRGINGLESTYLRFIIGSHFFTDYIKPIVTGINVPHISADQIKAFYFSLPPTSTQRKIAGILSAYDDLIENNTRRIAILEETAQAIYREWFVEFRFPGHEKVKLVDSPLGKIPEGWVVGRLDDVLVLQRGFDLPFIQRLEGNVPIYAATGVVGKHNEVKVKGPGVLTGRSGSLGTVTYVHEDYWPLNTTLWVKEFKKPSPLLAFYTLRSIDFSSFNSGAAVPTLNRNDIHGLPTLVPPDKIVAAFHENELPLFDAVRILRAKNEVLRATRDLILPKLISGEVDVEDLDIDVGELVVERGK